MTDTSKESCEDLIPEISYWSEEEENEAIAYAKKEYEVFSLS